MSAKFAAAGVHRSLDGQLACKIVRACAEERQKIAELIDGCRDVSAKIRTKPTRRVRRERGFTAECELICLLFDVQLLDLNLFIVKRSSEHNGFGGAIAPREPGKFGPHGASYGVRLRQVSAKSKVARME